MTLPRGMKKYQFETRQHNIINWQLVQTKNTFPKIRPLGHTLDYPHVHKAKFQTLDQIRIKTEQDPSAKKLMRHILSNAPSVKYNLISNVKGQQQCYKQLSDEQFNMKTSQNLNKKYLITKSIQDGRVYASNFRKAYEQSLQENQTKFHMKKGIFREFFNQSIQPKIFRKWK